MFCRYRSVPDFFFRYLSSRLTGKPFRRIGLIGGSDGPSAVYIARKYKPRYHSGKLRVSPDPHAAREALTSALLLAAASTILSLALHYAFGKRTAR